MRFPSAVRRAAVGLLTTALLVGGAVPASAGTPAAIRVEAQVGVGCVWIITPLKNKLVTLTQKRGGAVIRTASGKTSSNRDTSLCVSAMRIGDVLVIKQATRKRTLTVPPLEAKPNANDTVTGRLPLSQGTIDLDLVLGLGGRENETIDLPTPMRRADGTFTQHVEANINGSDRTWLRWTSPKGDQWFAISDMLPAFIAEAGAAKATIVDRVGRTVTLTLRSAGGAVRGTATATLGKGTKVVTFRKNGDPVIAQIGDRVSTSSLSGKSLALTDHALTLDGTAHGGDLTASCVPDARWRVDVFQGARIVYAWGGTTETGTVEFSDVIVEADDPTGYRVVLECESPNGFVQRSRATFE